MNKQIIEDKLLRILNDEEFEKVSMRDLFKAMYFQIIQSQAIELDLKRTIQLMNVRIKTLEDTLSTKFYIRGSSWLQVRYDNRLSEIIVSNRYRINFKDTDESELLRLMFVSTTKKPKAIHWQCSELADKFKLNNQLTLATTNKVYKAAIRIRNRLREEIGEDFLSVKSKEFFWYNLN